MAGEVLHLRLISPEEVLFEGEVSSVVAPAWDGRVGILPNHAPFLTLLAGGELAVDLPTGGSRSFFVLRGLLRVEDNRVTVLAERASRDAPAGRDTIPSWFAAPEDPGSLAPANPLV